MVQFDNTEKAYGLKSNSDLYKSYLIYRLIANKYLVAFSTQVAWLILKLRLPFLFVFKKTIYKQFCAGEQQEDSLKIVNLLASQRVKSYMHFAAEAEWTEEGMEDHLQKSLDTLSFSKGNTDVPFTVFKPTGLGSLALFKKKTASITLSEEEQQAWERMLKRIERFCEKAIELNVKVLIDAEETWIQGAIDEVAERLMTTYNLKTPYIFTTLQMYRKDRMEYLKSLYEKAEQGNFYLGVKLVRGAYIEKENDRAEAKGYPSPLCESKAKTDEEFSQALHFILPRVDRCHLFLGSHNEANVLQVVDYMKNNTISTSDQRIWFSQLYGMADHITFNLADGGYQVIKYVPYGPVRKVIPYLIRRADENTSVSGQTPRELDLLRKELKRRKIKAF